MLDKIRVEMTLDTDGYFALHEFLRAHGKGLFVIEFLGRSNDGDGGEASNAKDEATQE